MWRLLVGSIGVWVRGREGGGSRWTQIGDLSINLNRDCVEREALHASRGLPHRDACCT